MMASSRLSTAATSSSSLDADDSQTTAKAKKLLTRDKKSARSLAILILLKTTYLLIVSLSVCPFLSKVIVRWHGAYVSIAVCTILPHKEDLPFFGRLSVNQGSDV